MFHALVRWSDVFNYSCLVDTVFLPRYERGDDNLLKASEESDFRKKKKKERFSWRFLFIHSQLACSNGRSHVRRSHFFVFTQPCEKLLSVTASATRVCVCAWRKAHTCVCVYTWMSRRYLHLTRAFSLLMARHAAVSSCIVSPEQCVIPSGLQCHWTSCRKHAKIWIVKCSEAIC